MKQKLSELQKLVQETIDKGATSVEQVHTSIANMPFEALEKIAPLAETAKNIKGKHNQTIGSVYNTIRKVNEQVGDMAKELLAKLDK